MSRVEQLSRVLKFLAEKAEEKSEGTFEEMTVWNLGTIGTILADISQSLAVIADSMSGIEASPTGAESEAQNADSD